MNQLYVKVENDTVTACWDTPYPVNEAGLWRDAIEVRPAIVPHRQGYTSHTFDLTKNPVEIVYGTYDITVDERKAGMKAAATHAFQQVVQEQARDPAIYDSAAIEAARAAVAPKVAAIDAAATHDDLDLLM